MKQTVKAWRGWSDRSIHESTNPLIHRAAALLLVLLGGSADCLAQCCPPSINAGPNSVTVTQGSIATFSVSVSSATLWTNEWYFNGTNPVAGGTHSSAETTASLLLTNAQVWQQGSYSVQVGNLNGSVLSTSATLTVTVPLGSVVGWGTNSYGQIAVPAGLTNAVEIAAGGYHSLALRNNGTVVAWGDGTYGETAVPAGMSNVVAIAAGGSHSLALSSNFTVVGWGYSSNGEANGTINTTYPYSASGPVVVAGAPLTNILAVACGIYHSLALRNDGKVIVWGSGANGQTNVPAGLSNVVSVAGGGFHSLALKGDGTVVAWGYNFNGQTNVPAGLSNVVAVAAGVYHSLALLSNGTVVGWGYNAYGEANPPAGLSNVVAIAAGEFHSVALRNDGSVVAWGDNTGGQTSVPAGLNSLSMISAGYFHNLALQGNGLANLTPYQPTGWSDKIVVTTAPGQTNDAPLLTTTNNLYLDWAVWNNGSASTGLRFYTALFLDGALIKTWYTDPPLYPTYQAFIRDYPLGQLSGGTHTLKIKADFTSLIAESNQADNDYSKTIYIVAPPTIVTPPQSQTVVQGTNVTFNVVATGDPPLSYLWTSNGFTIFGATSTSYTITNVQAREAASYRARVTNPAGPKTSAAAILTVLLNPGMAAAWGENNYGQVTVSPSLSGVKAVAAGVGHSVALKNDGTVAAWGLNTLGQADVPPGLSNVVSISAHGNHSLALKDDGTVVAWGSDSYGQSDVPPGLSNVVAIAAGYNHSMALLNDGTVSVWGDNSLGQANEPPGLSDVVTIAAGYYHNLAIKTDGSIVGWGYNFAGETMPPPGLSGVAAVAGGLYFSMALLTNRTVVAWGTNNFGIINGASAVSNVIAIAGGGYHCLALLSNGKVSSWGYNGFAQTNVPGGVTNMIAIAAGEEHSLAAQGDGSPVITVQPLSQQVNAGANPAFTVMATGYAPLSYQWRLNATNILSPTNWLCGLANVQSTDAGDYTVVVSNHLGSVTSSIASLTLTANVRLIANGFTNGGFMLTVIGPASTTASIEASTNLTDWLSLYTNTTDAGGSFFFIDASVGWIESRFYRARLQ